MKKAGRKKYIKKKEEVHELMNNIQARIIFYIIVFTKHWYVLKFDEKKKKKDQYVN